MNKVFTFIDAWQKPMRDKAIEKKLEKLNNTTLPKVAYDKQAKFGAKSKKQILVRT